MNGDPEPLPLNCPKCGKRLRPLRGADPHGNGRPVVWHEYECQEHGPFHFSREVPLTPGRAPRESKT